MEITFVRILCSGVACLAGAVIGLAFGVLQNAALRKHEEQELRGNLKNGWSLMPGAGARVAYLLLALVAVQFVCPMLFADGVQWWVSGGLLLGYGWNLWQRLRERRARLG